MKEKEKLIFEMENLIGVLKDCLQALENEEISETAYRRLGESIFSVLWELRYYLGVDQVDSVHAAGIDPDIQGMDFE